MKKFIRKYKKVLKWGIVAVVLVVGIVFVYQKFFVSKFSASTAKMSAITTAIVETRDIQNVLSSSGTIEPVASYNLTTLVQGEVVAADFEEGDIVEEGQVLYQIATDNLDSDIDTAETTVERAKEDSLKAEENYQDALDDYEEAQADYKEAASEYNNGEVKSSETGIIKTLFVEEGDTIQKGSQIAEVYDNSKMLLKIPFGAADVDSSLVGKTAKIVVDDGFESLEGKVTKVSTIKQVLPGNRLAKEVTIEVSNPGGLTEQTTANAIIGNVYSVDTGTFSVKTNTIVTSELSGEIKSIKLEEGGSVSEGDVILKINEDSIEDQLESYRKAVENAQDAVDNAKDNIEDKKEAIEDAETKLQDVVDKRTDYSITAPITGKVISKNILKGDTISSSSNNSTLCVLYDLSSVSFDMYVDELDVRKVAEGQEVAITADALEGEKITGVVTNVSLESTSNQGVSQYPVTVHIKEVGNLLPGMNVTGEIIIEKAEKVLAIPSDALRRGEVVYVKDDTITEAVGEVPAGFRSLKVTTGITDGDYIEIKSGLSEGEEIYLARNSTSETFDEMMPGFGMNGGGEGMMYRMDGEMPNMDQMPRNGMGGGAFPSN